MHALMECTHSEACLVCADARFLDCNSFIAEGAAQHGALRAGGDGALQAQVGPRNAQRDGCIVPCLSCLRMQQQGQCEVGAEHALSPFLTVRNKSVIASHPGKVAVLDLAGHLCQGKLDRQLRWSHCGW